METLTQAAEQHGILVSELRASDYFGDDAGPVTHLGDRFTTPVRNGKTARVIGDPTHYILGPTSPTSGNA